jgi:hypothetical protein
MTQNLVGMLCKHDAMVYMALQDTIIQIRNALNSRGLSREDRNLLYASMLECKETQAQLFTQPELVT